MSLFDDESAMQKHALEKMQEWLEQLQDGRLTVNSISANMDGDCSFTALGTWVEGRNMERVPQSITVTLKREV